ncbi:hypothetical protein [Actibacterium pelagium]|uniref:Serine/threonine protein phosphatase n=1 Tax=Actibacterium pelagium TaxID=2029103 RepID=A0A917EJW8_9RHOB|nr:hypothetical protein [Actibacterium pelagium]GGE52775.1 hypothetical protein GCM10011517_20680 [Actibacterium pelagium]
MRQAFFISAPMRTYAIGDIHGYLHKLQEVHAWIAEDRAQTSDMDAPFVHVGDYTALGPDVRGVLASLASYGVDAATGAEVLHAAARARPFSVTQGFGTAWG